MLTSRMKAVAAATINSGGALVESNGYTSDPNTAGVAVGGNGQSRSSPSSVVGNDGAVTVISSPGLPHSQLTPLNAGHVLSGATTTTSTAAAGASNSVGAASAPSSTAVLMSNIETTANSRVCCMSLRMLALSMLVCQNCAAVLLMRYTQTRRALVPYSTLSVIASTEIVKILACLFQMVFQDGKSLDVCVAECWTMEGLRMVVPAGLYTLQNGLLFVALANLEATLFQVTYQLKLLITALFMVVLLNRKLSAQKWISLAVLFAGIVFTQLKASSTSRKEVSTDQLIKGLAAVITCATSSAFASVYFEKLVKNTQSSLSVRNIQLGFFSLIFALSAYFFVERRSAEGFMDGYDTVVWILIFNQAVGGILVAVVIKYADNILKGFATAMAIIVSGVVSYFVLDFQPSANFLMGASLVICAVALYAREDPKPAAASVDSKK